MGIMSTATSLCFYDTLKDHTQELFNQIAEECTEFKKLDDELKAEFISDLQALGITTADQFEEAYCTSYPYKPDESHLGDFSEWLTVDVDGINTHGLVVDWMSSWYRNFRYEFSTIDMNTETYFFHKEFMSSN